MVIKIDPNALPVYQLALSTKGDLAGLQALAEDTISQRFERLDGVASVDIMGGKTGELYLEYRKYAAFMFLILIILLGGRMGMVLSEESL